jgi:hypothetical protein
MNILHIVSGDGMLKHLCSSPKTTLTADCLTIKPVFICCLSARLSCLASIVVSWRSVYLDVGHYIIQRSVAHIRRFYFKVIAILNYNFNVFYHKILYHMLDNNLISAFYFLNLFGSGRTLTEYMFCKKRYSYCMLTKNTKSMYTKIILTLYKLTSLMDTGFCSCLPHSIGGPRQGNKPQLGGMSKAFIQWVTSQFYSFSIDKIAYSNLKYTRHYFLTSELIFFIPVIVS